VASETDVWVVANFKETQLTDMKPGQSVVFEADSYPGVEFRGKVDSISGATGARFALLPPDNSTGNYVKVTQRVPVKIVLDQAPDSDHPLRPGMSVDATVSTRE
jgi:membrane fusion protein (multidrug efflux system)